MRGHDSLDHLRRVFAVLALAMLWSAVPARADQILQTSSDSLTTYKYSGNTRVQGVRPRAEQRGVGFDGAQRAGGSLPWALAGNPFESAQAGETLGSLRLATGAYAPAEIDLALPAQVSWIVGRTFNARQAASGGAHLDSDGYQGRNWFQISQPELRLYDADSNPSTRQAADLVYVVYGADRYVEFKRTADNADTFRGVNGAAGNRSRDERWLDASGNLALSQTGNWLRRRLDLNGDGSFTATNELDDTGVFSLANELKTRDTDSSGTPNLTLVYDKSGNQTADGLGYGYTYDAFGRLVAVHKETDTGVVYAQYRYNGLGFRIGWRYDTSGNGYVDTNDPWYWFCHDDAWRIVATFRATDTYPKEVFVHHNAGFGGYGGSSYIDSVILRDKEVKAKWSEEATEERGERRYYCQNWRADVSALLTDAGSMVEWAKYSSYGVPFALPTGDTDSDGDWDATDSAAITGTYDVRKDANLDGVINASDVTHANSITGGYQTLGRGILSSSGVANRKGYAGYEYDPTLEAAGKHLYHVRHRVYDADIGRWMRRDPLGYVDGTSLYEYVRTRPIIHTDPMGQWVHVVGGCAVGAVFGGGWEYISCKMRGEADCRCKAGCAAAAGCIEGACTAAFPGVWSRCLCGAVAAALEAGCQATLCSSPGGGTGNSGMCIAVEIVLRALANCTGGLDVEAQEKLLLWVFGMNLSAISDICDNLRDFARSDIAHAGVQGPKTVRVLGSHVIDRARSMPPACRASLLQSGAHR